MSINTAAAKREKYPGSRTGRLRSALHSLADRAHASSDARAQAMGWTVAAAPGPLGLAGRTYRDPRFTTRRPSHRRPARMGRPA